MPWLALVPIVYMQVAAAKAVVKVAKRGYTTLADIRDTTAKANILRELADCLERGGLSTVEVRETLLEQGLESDIVDRAIRRSGC
jgi:hypothetical protein